MKQINIYFDIKLVRRHSLHPDNCADGTVLRRLERVVGLYGLRLAHDLCGARRAVDTKDGGEALGAHAAGDAEVGADMKHDSPPLLTHL